jgi:hypothetical protein
MALSCVNPRQRRRLGYGRRGNAERIALDRRLEDVSGHGQGLHYENLSGYREEDARLRQMTVEELPPQTAAALI